MLEDEEGGTALRGGCWRAMAREGEATREGGVNTLHGCSELRSQSSRRASEVKAYDTIATPSRHQGQSRRRQGGPPRERESPTRSLFYMPQSNTSRTKPATIPDTRTASVKGSAFLAPQKVAQGSSAPGTASWSKFQVLFLPRTDCSQPGISTQHLLHTETQQGQGP